MSEVFFAGCNGFGTIYLLSGKATDANEFASGTTAVLLPYTPDEFLGVELVVNGPYYTAVGFQGPVGTHKFQVSAPTHHRFAGTKSSSLQGFAGKTRVEACTKLSTALTTPLVIGTDVF